MGMRAARPGARGVSGPPTATRPGARAVQRPALSPASCHGGGSDARRSTRAGRGEPLQTARPRPRPARRRPARACGRARGGGL